VTLLRGGRGRGKGDERGGKGRGREYGKVRGRKRREKEGKVERTPNILA